MSGTSALPFVVNDVKDGGAQTLMEKWREAYNDRDRRMNKSVWLPRVFLATLTVTLLISLHLYLLPYCYRESSQWTIYQLKILACFLCANSLANLVCVICYDTSIKKSNDRPTLPKHLQEMPPDRFTPNRYNQTESSKRLQNGANGVANSPNGVGGDRLCDGTELSDGLPWRYCAECDLDLPPRAVHCKTCNKCILKRDHHCYMTAVCIGHYNQRYFIMLCFFGFVYCGWGAMLTYEYAADHFWSEFSWLDFLPPWSGFKVLSGTMDLKRFMMIHHLLWISFFSIAGLVYSSGQFMLVTLNKTLYEFAKKDIYRSTTSIPRNFRSVFGEFWLLNFIFPTQIIFRQTDDGYHWEGLKKK